MRATTFTCERPLLSNGNSGLRDSTIRKKRAGVKLVLTDDVGKLKGKSLETYYRLHGSPFFGVLLRRPHVSSAEELSDLLETAVDQGMLSMVEAVKIQRADLVVRGTRREDGTVVYLVVEVSWSVDAEAVEQATRRAAR